MQYAPKPKSVGSLQHAVVEVVASLGGATRKDIATYLPTVYAGKASLKQIEAALSNGVTRGYLISDHTSGNRKYRRAPLEYFQARQKVLRAQYRKSKRKARAKKPAAPRSVKPSTPKPQPQPIARANVRLAHMVDRETAITWALVTFVGGLGIGLALGGLL